MRVAATEADLANAIGTMLEELHDPATRVFAASSEPVSSELPLARRDRDVLIVNAGPYAAAHEGIWAELQTLAGEVSKAQAIVVSADHLDASALAGTRTITIAGPWRAAIRVYRARDSFELLPRFIAAQSADEYAAAVLEIVARVEDGHSAAFGHPSVPKLLGTAPPAIQVRLVEDQFEFVVTKTLDESSAVRPGDIVVSADGEPFRSRVNRLRKYVTASTERARINRIAATALRGEPGSEAVLELQGADGLVRTARLTRNQRPPEQPVADAYRVLDNNAGYVDLTTLTAPQVDAMFDALMKTKAIIFDMRGYPHGTGWQIAPRINRRNAKIGAVFRRPQVSGAFSLEQAASGFYFEQPLPNSDKPIFSGQTIMLIDDRAISQAEHTALFFEAASGTTFIGSHTAGANGDVTNFRAPGGFRIAFTGHDVRHADGRQLQRVGIVPHVEAEPTIRGIREARDEVLQRGIDYANQLVR